MAHLPRGAALLAQSSTSVNLPKSQLAALLVRRGIFSTENQAQEAIKNYTPQNVGSWIRNLQQPSVSRSRANLFRQATKAIGGPSKKQAQAIQRTLTAPPRRRVTNFPPNVPALLADSLVQAIIKAKTAADAKTAVQQAPKPVVEQALEKIPQRMDPKVLATIVVEAVRKGVAPPIRVIAPTLARPTTAAPVVAVLDPTVLAKAVIEAVRKGLVPVPEAVAPTLVSENTTKKIAPLLNPTVMAKAVIEAVRKGLVPVPEAVAVATSSPVSAAVAAKVVSVIDPKLLGNAVTKAIQKGLVPRITLPVNFSGKGKMAVPSPANQPNFMEPNKNNQGRPKPPPPGYILTTRTNNTGVPKTGWYRNKGPGVPLGPAGPPAPRNYTKMTIRELLDAMKKYPENRSTIVDALRKALEKAIRDIKYEYSKSRRARKLGDLLRLLPRNYNGRRNASSMVVNDIRETRNGRELSNVRSNLGRVPNENIRRAFENQRRRFERNRATTGTTTTRRYGNSYEPRGRYGNTYAPRRYGESNNNYTRRVKNTEGQRELMELMRRRRAAYLGGNGGGGGGNGAPGGGGVPPLPTNQQRAINNAGGVNKAMNTVVQVPGGASEIAKAAEALNESKGNTTYAIRVKGASPAAVNAVQKLGGSNNAVHVLEGLNTMSKTHGTRKRGGRRSAKVLRPRVAELARVISAVKKQRLISLVAHNVTKTHNIHPNDEKLKKYYMKVLKANILRTPFAKIAKGAVTKKRG